jgi:hypothetical protein
VTKGLCVLLLAVLAAACSPTVAVKEGFEVLDVSTAWLDAGIVNGQNKLVPSITFRLKNVSDQRLQVIQVNATFRQVNNPQDWGSAFLKVTGVEGLEPGATSEVLTATSNHGYTSPDPRAEMLNNEKFIDAKVELAAKHGSELLERIAEFPIERRLIAK